MWKMALCRPMLHGLSKINIPLYFLITNYNFYFIIWQCHLVCGILVPQPRIKPVLPALQGGFLTTLLFVKLPLICIIFSGLSCPGSLNWASHLHNTFGLDFSFPLFPIFCWCWVTELVSTLPPTFLIVKAPCAFCKILQTVQKRPQ